MWLVLTKPETECDFRMLDHPRCGQTHAFDRSNIANSSVPIRAPNSLLELLLFRSSRSIQYSPSGVPHTPVVPVTQLDPVYSVLHK